MVKQSLEYGPKKGLCYVRLYGAVVHRKCQLRLQLERGVCCRLGSA